MKHFDGSRMSLIAHAFSFHHRVRPVDVHLNASSQEEADAKLARKLQCRQDFLRATGGKFQVKYTLLPEHGLA